MSKKSKQQVAAAEPVIIPSKAEILSDTDAYKTKFGIPLESELAWHYNDLPKYFIQQDRIFIKDKLPSTHRNEFETPIWFFRVTSPLVTEGLEMIIVGSAIVNRYGFNLGN